MDITYLILKSDIVIKSIMIILLIFSVVSWAIFFSKLFYIKKTLFESKNFYNNFITGRDMDSSYLEAKSHPDGVLPSIYVAGYNELKDLSNNAFEKESMENIQRSMIGKKDEEINKLDSKISVLATITTSSPFLGLLGTVWGLINAFRGLMIEQQNTLSAVAPGISDALVTTAMGLFVAIPSVIFYNHISRKIEKIDLNASVFIMEFMNITYKTFLQPIKNIAENKFTKKITGNK
jgi:biopolymer transport protein TolQ